MSRSKFFLQYLENSFVSFYAIYFVFSLVIEPRQDCTFCTLTFGSLLELYSNICDSKEVFFALSERFVPFMVSSAWPLTMSQEGEESDVDFFFRRDVEGSVSTN
jgi:hypothetical protein